MRLRSAMSVPDMEADENVRHTGWGSQRDEIVWFAVIMMTANHTRDRGGEVPPARCGKRPHHVISPQHFCNIAVLG